MSLISSKLFKCLLLSGVVALTTLVSPSLAIVSKSPLTNQDGISSGDRVLPENTVKTKTVGFSNLKTYKHRNNIFSIKVPKNWTKTDTSTSKVINLVWVDPTENAFVHVNIVSDMSGDTGEYGSNFVTGVFGSLNGFSLDELVSTGNGSHRVAWSYYDDSTNGKVKLIGNSFVKKYGGRTAIFTSVVPDDQFDDLRLGLDGILNSLTVRKK
jgi:hypothetical protein